MAVNIEKTVTTAQLDDSIARIVEGAKTAVLTDLPIDKIIPHPKNVDFYGSIKESEVLSLMTVYEERGFSGAISVHYLADQGLYQVYAGHVRHEAMRRLHDKYKENGKNEYSTIPSIIDPLPTDKNGKVLDHMVVLKLIDMNHHGRKSSPLIMAREMQAYINALRDSGQRGSQEDILAGVFKVSPRQVTKLLALNKCIDKLQNLASDPSFPYEALGDVLEDQSKNILAFTPHEQNDLVSLIAERVKLNPEAGNSSTLIISCVEDVKRKRALEASKKAQEERIKNSTIGTEAIPVPVAISDDMDAGPLVEPVNIVPSKWDAPAPIVETETASSIVDNFMPPSVDQDNNIKMHVGSLERALISETGITVSKEVAEEAIASLERIINVLKGF